MSDIVFILGAGASSEAGAPVMKDFLDRAENLYRNDRRFQTDPDYKRVFDARAQLLRATPKSRLDIYNVESVFGAFEMAASLGDLGGLDPSDVRELPNSMRRVIARTLVETIKFHRSSSGELVAPGAYGAFASIVKRHIDSCVIVTFNYDVALEFALALDGVPPYYGVEPQRASGSVRVIKFHGSLNWGRCRNRECGRIAPLDMPRLIVELQRYPRGLLRGQEHSGTLDLTQPLARTRCPHCGAEVDPTPVIVPPVYDKGVHREEQLRDVWRSALLELRDARSLFICGYSLPPTDNFFPYLLTLGMMSDIVLQRFVVCDPDPAVERRFRQLIGDTAEARFNFRECRFSEAVVGIAKELQAA